LPRALVSAIMAGREADVTQPRSQEHDGGPVAKLTILDWIGLAMIVPFVVALLAAPLVVTPAFASMFAEFGSEGALPAITQLVMSWWVPTALALVPIGLTIAAITGHRSLGVRRLLGVTAFLAGLGGCVFYLVGLYAPIFEIAGAVR
jgi:hypothetical protein